jgi:protein disulfide-isomerase A1
MIKSTLFGLLILFLVSIDNTSASNVLNLNDGDFSTQINQQSCVLVKFFTNWCGYCRMLKEPYEEAASILKQNNLVDVLAEVNCEKNQKACSDVPYYPLLRLYKNGAFIEEYRGRRRTSAIVDYVTSKCN